MGDVTTTATGTPATTAATDANVTTTAAAPATTTATTALGNFDATMTAAATTALGAVAAPGTPAATTAAGTTDEYGWLPEKFRVKDGDAINFNASAQKLGEAYGSLEKRFGSGDLRPADPTGYKFDQTVLGGNFDSAQFLAAPGIDGFMKQVHELGFTDKQLNFMVGELIQATPTEAANVAGLTAEQAQTALREIWNEPAVFNRNMTAANTAARALLKDDYAPFINRYGNDPAVVKLLALVGSEMSEDALRLAGQVTLSPDSVQELMNSDAYFDPNHPDHKRVAGQVRDYFAKTTPNLHS